MEDLIAKRFNLDLVKGLLAGDVLVASGVLGYEGALSNDGAVFVKSFFAAELVDLGHESSTGYT